MRRTVARLTVELDEQTFDVLRSQAETGEQSLDELVQAAIVAYVRDLSVLPEALTPSQERRTRIRQEAAAWRAMPAEERHRYGDVFVAVLDGAVVDSDEDRLALLKRVRDRYAGAPLLITPAHADAPREFLHTGLKRS